MWGAAIVVLRSWNNVHAICFVTFFMYYFQCWWYIQHIETVTFSKNFPTISINSSLKLIPKDPFNNTPALVQIIAWRRTGEKSIFDSMMPLSTDTYNYDSPSTSQFILMLSKHVPYQYIYFALLVLCKVMYKLLNQMHVWIDIMIVNGDFSRS